MIVTLRKQVLYDGDDATIYQTFDPERRLYGMCRVSAEGTKFLPAIYLYTFKFDHRSGICAVVTQNDQYKKVTLRFGVLGMGTYEEGKHRNSILKNSLCACVGDDVLIGSCGICNDNLQIQNPYAYQQNKRILGR